MPHIAIDHIGEIARKKQHEIRREIDSMEYIVCCRDGIEQFPSRITPNSKRVLYVEWSWAFLNSRFDEYKATFSKDKKTVLVWVKDVYWVEGDPPKRFEPYCAGPFNGDFTHSALSAIERAWSYEQSEFDLDEPHMLGWIDEDYMPQYEAILKKIWNTNTRCLKSHS